MSQVHKTVIIFRLFLIDTSFQMQLAHLLTTRNYYQLTSKLLYYIVSAYHQYAISRLGWQMIDNMRDN